MSNDLPVAHYTLGGETMSGTRVIVKNCPYCGRQHVHSTRKSNVDGEQRASDCIPGGEYILQKKVDES